MGVKEGPILDLPVEILRNFLSYLQFYITNSWVNVLSRETLSLGDLK